MTSHTKFLLTFHYWLPSLAMSLWTCHSSHVTYDSLHVTLYKSLFIYQWLLLTEKSLLTFNILGACRIGPWDEHKAHLKHARGFLETSWKHPEKNISSKIILPQNTIETSFKVSTTPIKIHMSTYETPIKTSMKN